MVDEGALIFQAGNGNGSSIHFSEQKKPQDFDFDQSYQEEMGGAKQLENVPHQSYIGTSVTTQQNLLSIVIDDTWVLISTNEQLSEEDYVRIAKGLRPY